MAVNVELAWREAGEAKAEIEARAARRFARQQAEYEARGRRAKSKASAPLRSLAALPRHFSNLITRRPVAW